MNQNVTRSARMSSIIYHEPDELKFLDAEDEIKKCTEFKESLVTFQKQMGHDNFKVPSIGGKELDLCKLFKAVFVRGGSQQVSSRKLWKEIVNEFQIPSSCTSASFTLRNHYNKCLLAFENKYFSQHHPELIDQSDGLPVLSGPGPGRPVGSGNQNQAQQNLVGQSATTSAYEGQVIGTTSQSQRQPPSLSGPYGPLGTSTLGATAAQQFQIAQQNYRDLSNQTTHIFATTHVAHHSSASRGYGGLGLAPGQQIGQVYSPLAHHPAHSGRYPTFQTPLSIHNNQASVGGAGAPLISSTQQNFKFTMPNHLPEYKEQLQAFKKINGQAHSSLGGVSSLNNQQAQPSPYFVQSPDDLILEGRAYYEKAVMDHALQNQINQVSTAASLNYKSKNNYSLKVQLSQTEAESKRMALAFESRQASEINWALNTLAIFSCNANQNFTIENQPYLLEAMANYMNFCIQNIETLSYADPLSKRQNIHHTIVPTLIDAVQNPSLAAANTSSMPAATPGLGSNNLDYGNFGNYTRDLKELKKRDIKMEEKNGGAAGGGLTANQQGNRGGNGKVAGGPLGGMETGLQSMPRARGRKPIHIKRQEQNALDELRKKRKRLVSVLYQEISEVELIEHLRMMVLIIRNLTFVRANDHHIIKCQRLVDILTSLFVDLIDKEITLNCLDIITNIAKQIILSELNCGDLLVQALFTLFSSNSYLFHGDGEDQLYAKQQVVDQCIECLRRLSLSSGNEEYLEKISDKQIQALINLLMSKNLETREGVLEILFTISDRKTSLKVKIAQQKRCIERLIGLIAAGSQTPNEEKISKFAALTLANLNLAPSNRQHIVPYEQELALIASTDEKTCKIIAEILSDLDTYQVYAK